MLDNWPMNQKLWSRIPE